MKTLVDCVVVNFEAASCNSLLDILKNHFVTAQVAEADIDDRNKRKRIRVSLKNKEQEQIINAMESSLSQHEGELKSISNACYWNT